MFKAANPFVDQGPYKILTRQYKIAEFNITPSWTYQQLQFPQALLIMPAIEKALSSFYYFRSDIEVSVKINSTPYHQGLMCVSFLHDVDSDADFSLVQRTALSPMLLNYSTSDTITASYGWLHPEIYMRLDANTSECYIGSMTLFPLVPIDNTSGGSTTIACTVYARFLNPRTAGFTNQPPSVPRGQSGKNFKFAYMPEAQEKSADRLPNSNAHEDFLSPLFKTISLIGDTASTVIDGFSKLTGLLDKPMDLALPAKMSYGVGNDFINASGLVAGERLTLYPTSRLATFPISDSCHTSNMSVSQLAMIPLWHSLFDFTASATTLKLYAHPLVCDYFNNNVTAQPDYLAYVAGMHRYWKGGIKYFIYFVTNSFTTARFRISYIINYLETDLGAGGDFPSQIVDIKGSTQIKFTVPYLFQVPYRMVIPNLVTAGDGFLNTPKITIELLTLPTASQGTAPHITAVVFRAGAEDTQFASPHSQEFTPPFAKPAPEAIGQCSLQEEFKFKFDPISCECSLILEQGFTTTETVGKICDVMKRFAVCITEDIFQNMFYPTNHPIEVGDIDADQQSALQPYYQYLQLFKYQRGSVRIRYVRPWNATPANNTTYFTPSVTGVPDSGAGILAWIPNSNPVYTIELPWIGTIPYVDTSDGHSIYHAQVMDLITYGYDDGGVPTDRFVAWGDDRVHSYLLPPPKIHFNPVLKEKKKIPKELPPKTREKANNAELKTKLPERHAASVNKVCS